MEGRGAGRSTLSVERACSLRAGPRALSRVEDSRTPKKGCLVQITYYKLQKKSTPINECGRDWCVDGRAHVGLRDPRRAHFEFLGCVGGSSRRHRAHGDCDGVKRREEGSIGARRLRRVLECCSPCRLSVRRVEHGDLEWRSVLRSRVGGAHPRGVACRGRSRTRDVGERPGSACLEGRCQDHGNRSASSDPKQGSRSWSAAPLATRSRRLHGIGSRLFQPRSRRRARHQYQDGRDVSHQDQREARSEYTPRTRRRCDCARLARTRLGRSARLTGRPAMGCAPVTRDSTERRRPHGRTRAVA